MPANGPPPERPAGRFARPHVGDMVAGLSVALVVIPQSLAYAELAGMPAYHGLYAAALAPILAAIFASSPYLQTGPTAMTSLLVFGALTPLAAPMSAEFIGLAALLALLVGAIRVGLGLLRAGSLAYFLSTPVLTGFTVAAALLILCSQLPGALGVSSTGDGVMESAFFALASPSRWDGQALIVTVSTIACVLGGRRIHALFPGIVVAAGGALSYSVWVGYSGAVIGSVPDGSLQLSLELPWHMVGILFVPAATIAVVGFAEPTAIARHYAALERRAWSPSKELVSQGAANLASGIAAGFPVGGSFSRSALNHVAGARTRLSGALTGLVVVLFIPFASVLAAMPRATLSAIVIVGIISLFRHARLLLVFWRQSIPQAAIAWVTFALSLALAPRVDYAILVGIGLSVVVHSWREMRLYVDWVLEDDVLTLRPRGVLWFASAQHLETELLHAIATYPAAAFLRVDIGGLGRVDYTGALALRSAMELASDSGLVPSIIGIPPQCERIVAKVCCEYASVE